MANLNRYRFKPGDRVRVKWVTEQEGNQGTVQGFGTMYPEHDRANGIFTVTFDNEGHQMRYHCDDLEKVKE
jgi:protein involved in polysaccharide export with SLBB domain